jgi:hypothetical protein
LLRAWREPGALERFSACPAPYDHVLTTGLADAVAGYADAGARALPLLPSAPPVAIPPTSGRRDIDIVFAGRLDGRERRSRVEFLSQAAHVWRVAVATPNGDGWPGAYAADLRTLTRLHRRARLSFHTERVAISRCGITRAYGSGRPLFGPAHGCALLAELHPWLTHCFNPARELAPFASVAHAFETAGELLRSPDLLLAIARAGSARCSEQHSALDRARQIAQLLQGEIPIEMQILALGPWYQSIELPCGVKTSLLEHSNVRRWERLREAFPAVAGRRVLDLGANAGYFALQCARLGASRVVAVERSPLACAQARFVMRCCAAPQVEIVEGAFDAAPPGSFDVCLALALLHHLPETAPLLDFATQRAPIAVLEWEVRREPYFHPIEKIAQFFESRKWQVRVISGGRRPIVIAARDS